MSTFNLEQAAATGMTIAYHAEQVPQNNAVISKYGSRTFAELNARVNQLSRV
jgi:long-chain acyl-CoA synthetase